MLNISSWGTICGDSLWRIKSWIPSRKSDNPACNLIVWYNSSMKMVNMRLDMRLVSAMECCKLLRLPAKFATAAWLSLTAVRNLVYQFSEIFMKDDKLSVNTAIFESVLPDFASNALICRARSLTSLTHAVPNNEWLMSPMNPRAALLDLEIWNEVDHYSASFPQAVSVKHSVYL